MPLAFGISSRNLALPGEPEAPRPLPQEVHQQFYYLRSGRIVAHSENAEGIAVGRRGPTLASVIASYR